MNTRTQDLERLVVDRDRGNKAAKKILEKVHLQSKDPEIERLRKLLIEAHKRNDLVKVEAISEELSKRG